MRGNGKIRGFFIGIALAGLANIHPATVPPEDKALVQPAPSSKPDIYVETYVTGYNTVPGQTDDTPCIAASGANICGRRDAIACPPLLPLGAIVEIKARSTSAKTGLLESTRPGSISTATKISAARLR